MIEPEVPSATIQVEVVVVDGVEVGANYVGQVGLTAEASKRLA